MQVHRKYFYWDNKLNLPDIKLGDKFNDLKKQGIIKDVENDERGSYHKETLGDAHLLKNKPKHLTTNDLKPENHVDFQSFFVMKSTDYFLTHLN